MNLVFGLICLDRTPAPKTTTLLCRWIKEHSVITIKDLVEKGSYKIIKGKRYIICCENGVFGRKHDCMKSNPKIEVNKLKQQLKL